MKRKILMLLDNPLESDFRVEKEAESLGEYGNRVVVMATKKEELPRKEKRELYTIERCLDDTFKKPYQKGYREYLINTAKRIASLDFDDLHCHDYHMIILGAEVKKNKPSIRLIYDSHEFLAGWPFYKASRGIVNRLKGYLVWKRNISDEKRAVLYADEVITVSEKMSQLLRAHFKLGQKPIVLRNVPNKFPLSREKYFHNHFDLPVGTKIILNSGNIYQTDKQLKSLFNIVDSIEGIRLVIIGNRPRFYEVKSQVEGSRY
ncbi:MAG: glycosyltransferase, partial [Cyclobacteriaceae bacterium]